MKKEIKIFKLASSRLNQEQITKWLHENGAYETEIHLDPEATETEKLIGLAAKRCYKSFEVGLNPNVTKIREDWTDYIDNILKSGHGSVLEHASFTFAIENCTRVFTAEMNRHRAGVAISEGSLRYIRFEEGIDYWEPLSIKETEEDRLNYESFQDSNLNKSSLKKKQRTRDIFQETFEFIEGKYKKLCEIWDIDGMTDFGQKKILTSMFRRIVPLGVSTGAVYTMNIRAIRHIMTMRCSPAAEEEIAHVMGLIAKEMISSEPDLFNDFDCIDGYWRPKYVKV